MKGSDGIRWAVDGSKVELEDALDASIDEIDDFFVNFDFWLERQHASLSGVDLFVDVYQPI